MHRPGNKRVVGVAAALTVLTSCSEAAPMGSRQEEVARRGATVMPFDLERTTHYFKPLTDGGVQTVEADDPSDAEQIRLIREHLRKEAVAFARGDFGDPEQIHGPDMPGLEELRGSYDDIALAFSPTPAGGRIRYKSSVPQVVDALHRWFEAQLMDHGDHAAHGD
ncbi:MAG: aspartate carbamoyltransferase [Actinomycetota bacterium]|nr:aspartate carbamoyltransferase [Actinomycetota bacterium]